MIKVIYDTPKTILLDIKKENGEQIFRGRVKTVGDAFIDNAKVQTTEVPLGHEIIVKVVV